MEKNNQQKKLYKKKWRLIDFLNLDRVFLFTITKQRRQFLTRIAILFTRIGNGQIWLLLSIFLFVYNVPIGLAFQIAGLIQLYIHMILKKIFKRTRPFQHYFDLEVLYPVPDPYSFPSGHTCAAFTMAFVALKIIPIFWPYLLMVSLIISLSRIYLAAHYPSDVFGGIIIGYISAITGIYFSINVTGINLWIS